MKKTAKRLIAIFVFLSMIFAIISCGPKGEAVQVDKYFFRQASYSHGGVLFGATGREQSFNTKDYNEIIDAFEKLRDGYKLDEVVYAFDYSGDDFTVNYHFTVNPRIDEPIDPNEIKKLSDCIPLASFIHYGTSVAINAVTCDKIHRNGGAEHTAWMGLVFDDTQPEPMIIVSREHLNYKKAENNFIAVTCEGQYLYEIYYGDNLLFYLQSCVEMDDELFDFFKTSLVQFDGRPS